MHCRRGAIEVGIRVDGGQNVGQLLCVREFIRKVDECEKKTQHRNKENLLVYVWSDCHLGGRIFYAVSMATLLTARSFGERLMLEN